MQEQICAIMYRDLRKNTTTPNLAPKLFETYSRFEPSIVPPLLPDS
jgi:hypothetical protein